MDPSTDGTVVDCRLWPVLAERANGIFGMQGPVGYFARRLYSGCLLFPLSLSLKYYLLL